MKWPGLAVMPMVFNAGFLFLRAVVLALGGFEGHQLCNGLLAHIEVKKVNLVVAVAQKGKANSTFITATCYHITLRESGVII